MILGALWRLAIHVAFSIKTVFLDLRRVYTLLKSKSLDVMPKDFTAHRLKELKIVGLLYILSLSHILLVISKH